VQPGAAQRRRVLRQLQEQRFVAAPDLPQVDGVEEPRGLDDLRQRGPLAGGQRVHAGGHLRGSEAGSHLLQGGSIESGGEQQGGDEHGAPLPDR